MKNLDKCLIFSNLAVTTQLVTCMKTKPLIQRREMIAAALSSMTNLGKSFRTFIIETMELYLTSSGRMNFSQLARCGRSCESRFLQNFKKPFDWFSFNRQSGCNLIVADAYFSKESFVTGVKELGFNIISRFRDDVNLKYLYRGPKVRKRGRPQKFAGKVDLKHLDMNIFKEEYSVDDKLVYKLYTAEVWAVSLGREVRVVIVDYLDTDKKTQARKVFFSTDLTLSARDIFDIYRTRFQLEFVFRDAKQFTGLTHCQARNKEALAFAFNASLSSVNVARAYARQQGHNLSVGSTKTLLHNAAIVDRFIAMSAKHANLRLNSTDFKELLFYGVRAVA